MTATSPTAPSAVEAGKCWCVATTTAVGQSCTVLHRCSGYGLLDKGLLICNIHIHFVFVCEGVSAWSVWISWLAPARRRRPSKKTRGTATCADLETPTGYCGDGTTGPAGCSTSSPTTMSRNLWVFFPPRTMARIIARVVTELSSVISSCCRSPPNYMFLWQLRRDSQSESSPCLMASPQASTSFLFIIYIQIRMYI